MTSKEKRKDIETREDVVVLVDTFYKRALRDEVIGFIFTKVAKIDVKHHMPVMYDFWETTLLKKTSYRGNPMAIHLKLNRKQALSNVHFDRWLTLFNDTIDQLYMGPIADLAKTRALSIATMMQVKISREKSAN